MGEVRLVTGFQTSIIRNAVQSANAMSLAAKGINAGDTKLIWDPHNPTEVSAIRATFEELVKDKKFLAFKVIEGGGKGEQIRSFDPYVEKMIISPPMAGG